MPTMYGTSSGVMSSDIEAARRAARQAAARVPRATRAPVQAAGRAPLPPPTVVNDTTIPSAPQPPKPPGRMTNLISGARNAVAGPVGAAGKAAKFIGSKIVAPIAAGGAVLDAAKEDSTARYAERFGVQEPTGDGSVGDMVKFAALRAGGFASDLGDNLTGGLVGDALYADKQPGSASTRRAAQAPIIAAAKAQAPRPGEQPGFGQPAVVPQAPTNIISSARMGNSMVSQDGANSFTDGVSLQLPSRDISPGNQQALDSLTGQYQPPAAPAAPQDMLGLEADTIPENVMAARQLIRKRATLKAAGIRDPQALQGTDAFAAVAAPGAQGLITKTREAEMNRLTRADKAGAREDRAGQMQAQTAEQANAMLAQIAGLDEMSDPGGIQRADLINRIRALSGDFAPLPETPAEKRRAELGAAALKSGAPITPDTLNTIDSLSGAAPATGAKQQFQEGQVYTDGQGNRAKYVNGQWVEVR